LGFRFSNFLFQPLDALAQLLEALEPGEDGEELFALKRLFQKINRPPPHGFHGRFHVSLGGAHHHRHIRAALHNLGQQVQTALLNQIYVQQNGVELVLFEAFQRLFPGGRAFAVMPLAFNQDASRIPESFVVINDEKVHNTNM